MRRSRTLRINSRRTVLAGLALVTFLASATSGQQDRVTGSDVECPCRPRLEEMLLSGTSVLELSGSLLDSRAELRVKGNPPPSLRAHGPVRVHVVTDTLGKVVCVAAVSGHPLLRAPAESAARNWRFAPVTVETRPVALAGWVAVSFGD